MAKKITSITQIPSDSEYNSKPQAGHYRPEFKLTKKKTEWPFKNNMNSTNPAARYVQDVIKDARGRKALSPLDQLRRK